MQTPQHLQHVMHAAASTVSQHALPQCTQPWLAKVLEKLPDDQKDEFKAKSQPALKFLLSKVKDLQL